MNVHAPVADKGRLTSRPGSSFAQDTIEGLARRQKTLSPKYFYDAAGSELFEQITRLPEYYPTRTELGILRDQGAAIASSLPDDAVLVEFGAGATTKVRRMLESCAVSAYVPVDISGDFLTAQASGLRRDFPQLAVHPIVADFTASFALPDEIGSQPRVGFFPGSTIGNFEPPAAAKFLTSCKQILGPGAQMIVGVDLEKDEALLHAAYNDAAGVTAQFNLNLLVRINRELGGDFDLSAFRHEALYDRDQHRIEMHLVSTKAQTVTVLGYGFPFRCGETIHTENSYKYSITRFRALAAKAGWQLRQTWTDPARLFSVNLLAS